MNTERRLLVVDDEPIVGQSCSRIFSPRGYNVETCTDSREGLDRVLKNNNYSAILLDMKMPGLDGIEFLNELRKTHPDIPVMIITGYASIPSAVAAMRLGASDYIPKPFTPEEIIGAVERIFDETDVSTDRIATDPMNHPAELNDTDRRSNPTVIEKGIEVIVKKEARAWVEAQKEYRRRAEQGEFFFYDESWLQIESPGQNGTMVRIGSLMTGAEEGGVAGVQLPREGDVIYRGLPMASYTLPDGTKHILPSPVTGQVKEINISLLHHPDLAYTDPCGEGWIARVCPEQLSVDLWALKVRTIVLATNQESAWMPVQNRLNELGCQVKTVSSLETIHSLLADDNNAILFFDAHSFGVGGPAIIEEINEKHPRVKIAVGNDLDFFREKAYRMNRILYYSVEPFTNHEIGEILFSAFRPVERPTTEGHISSSLPRWISRLQITAKNGETVTLLTPGEQLARDRGLGWLIERTLLRTGLPVQTDLSIRPGSAKELQAALKESDCIMMLQTVDVGRIPGSIIRKETKEIPGVMLNNGKSITTYFVQPEPAKGNILDFDLRTGSALAQFLVYEMMSASGK